MPIIIIIKIITIPATFTIIILEKCIVIKKVK